LSDAGQKSYKASYGRWLLAYAIARKIGVLREIEGDIRNALQLEKNLKHWPRLWKLALIHEMNPDWADLYERLNW
jgi:putative endonuclease